MTFHILVVDDNDINVRLISKILDIEGHEVHSASNGDEAIKSVMQQAPDLAILDVMMPGMNGYELCEKLRQPPINSRFPIVMLTAMPSECEKKKALAAGANEVWSKPFDMDLFRQRIMVLLSGNGRSK